MFQPHEPWGPPCPQQANSGEADNIITSQQLTQHQRQLRLTALHWMSYLKQQHKIKAASEVDIYMMA
jgi:hypothetical protein